MKRREHNVSIEEYLQSKQNNLPKKKKLNGPRSNRIDGFELLGEDKEVCLTPSDLKTEFDFPKRKSTLIDLILYYFDDDFLDLMIEKNVEICSFNDLPPLYYNPFAKSALEET